MLSLKKIKLITQTHKPSLMLRAVNDTSPVAHTHILGTTRANCYFYGIFLSNMPTFSKDVSICLTFLGLGEKAEESGISLCAFAG